MPKKKTFKQINQEILQNSVNKYTDKLWLPLSNIKYIEDDSDSWFRSFHHDASNPTNFIFNHNYDVNDSVFNSFPIELLFNKTQKKIIHVWFESYRIMYNETVRLIKKFVFENKKVPPFYSLRSKYLKNCKTEIINYSAKRIKKIPSHTLDGAIKLARASFESAKSNHKGNVKKFTMHYWTRDKESLILNFEKSSFKKTYIGESIFPTLLGQNVKYKTDNDMKLYEIDKDSLLVYNKVTNKYILHVPVENNIINDYKNTNSVIGIDPGIRTFMTCYTSKKILKFGVDVYKKIEYLLYLIDRINNNPKIPTRKKKIMERRKYTKIKNLVDDLHWKTINEIIKNGKYILIGDMSAKGISRKFKSTLSKKTKRVAYMLSYGKFRSRLEYKCRLNGKFYNRIKEYYTSCMCTKCTNIKTNLGTSKEYNCNKCKIKVGKDPAGARNIAMKGMYLLKKIEK
jgi:IS605 OrfB family transposase